MHRSYPNVAPVTNKYLAHKKFLKDQENHKINVRFPYRLFFESPIPYY